MEIFEIIICIPPGFFNLYKTRLAQHKSKTLSKFSSVPLNLTSVRIVLRILRPALYLQATDSMQSVVAVVVISTGSFEKIKLIARDDDSKLIRLRSSQ